MRIFANPNYNFIKWRWHALLASMVIIWAGVASIYFKGGLPLGIDFSGGTALIVQFNQATSEDVVRKALDPLATGIGVQRYGKPEQHALFVRMPMLHPDVQGREIDADAKAAEAALRAANVGAFKITGQDIVGPIMGSDLRTKGILATLTALGGISLYVWFRFRLVFAIGALVATFHDILITLVFLSWFHYEMSLIIIAALLTITGYSVNDTIVVFDRVRENERNQRRLPLVELVNTSVNQTLGRTIITSGVTFLAVLALFLFGGEVLHGFAFTMLIGVLTGTYSTVFIAASLAIILSHTTPATGAAVPGARAAAKR